MNKGFIKDSEICVAAYQKKQEFGGGLGYIKNLECDGETFMDKNSFIYNLIPDSKNQIEKLRGTLE